MNLTESDISDLHKSEPLLQGLQHGMAQMQIELDLQKQLQLIRYVQLLHKWNRIYNLTAVRDKHDMVSRHLLDSLSLLAYVKAVKDAATVMDVGTGAGIPVIPLAICRPALAFVSVESVGKKTRFQQQAIQELQLRNIEVKQLRIEALDIKTDVIMARAFTAPRAFLNLASKKLKSGGTAIIMLGLKDKLPEQLPNGFTLDSLDAVFIPGEVAQRYIAVCQFSN